MTVWTELLQRRAAPPPVPAVAVVPPPASGFLADVVRGTAERAGQPMTAFEIARKVGQTHPNRWAESTIRRKAGKILTIVDCDGLSPQNEPCWRYRP